MSTAMRKVFFYNLDSTQATVKVGMIEIFAIIGSYLGFGIDVGKKMLEIAEDEKFRVVEGYSSDAIIAITLVVATGVTLLILLLPILLVFGAIKESRCMIIPWLLIGYLRLGSPLLAFPFLLHIYPDGSVVQIYAILGACFAYAETLGAVYVVHYHYGVLQNKKREDTSSLLVDSEGVDESKYVFLGANLASVS